MSPEADQRPTDPEAKPILCAVTDRNVLRAGEMPMDFIGRAAAAGLDWIQIREKDLPGRELEKLVRRAIAEAGEGTRVVVNDRLDIAFATGAAGVHLGRTALPVAEVVRWLSENQGSRSVLVGASCHSLAEAQAAERDGASYVFFGPVFETPAKRSFGAPQGIGKLAEVCHAVRVPVLAIGGITEANAGECLRCGARGIAAIRMFLEAPDLSALIARLRLIR